MWPPYNPSNYQFGLYPLNNNKPQCSIYGSDGGCNGYIRGILHHWGHPWIPAPLATNIYTFNWDVRQGVIDMQAMFGLAQTGFVNETATWNIFDYLSGQTPP